MSDPVINVTVVVQGVTITVSPVVYTVKAIVQPVALPMGVQGPQGIQGNIGPQGIQGPPGTGVVPYVEKTSDYYLQVGIDGFIGMDASGGSLTIFLPISAIGNKGSVFSVKKIDLTGTSAFVSTQMGQAIDGVNSLITYTFPGEEYNFMSTGVGWKIF